MAAAAARRCVGGCGYESGCGCDCGRGARVGPGQEAGCVGCALCRWGRDGARSGLPLALAPGAVATGATGASRAPRGGAVEFVASAVGSGGMAGAAALPSWAQAELGVAGVSASAVLAAAAVCARRPGWVQADTRDAGEGGMRAAEAVLEDTEDSGRGCSTGASRWAMAAIRSPGTDMEEDSRGEEAAGGGDDGEEGNVAGAPALSRRPAARTRSDSIRGTCLWQGRCVGVMNRCLAVASPAGLSNSRQLGGDAGPPSW